MCLMSQEFSWPNHYVSLLSSADTVRLTRLMEGPIVFVAEWLDCSESFVLLKGFTEGERLRLQVLTNQEYPQAQPSRDK